MIFYTYIYFIINICTRIKVEQDTLKAACSQKKREGEGEGRERERERGERGRGERERVNNCFKNLLGISVFA